VLTDAICIKTAAFAISGQPLSYFGALVWSVVKARASEVLENTNINPILNLPFAQRPSSHPKSPPPPLPLPLRPAAGSLQPAVTQFGRFNILLITKPYYLPYP
jgi:hypothetical protein